MMENESAIENLRAWLDNIYRHPITEHQARKLHAEFDALVKERDEARAELRRVRDILIEYFAARSTEPPEKENDNG